MNILNKKIWWGLRGKDVESIEEAITFYVDSDDSPKIRLFDSYYLAVDAKVFAEKNGTKDLVIFSLTYEEKEQ